MKKSDLLFIAVGIIILLIFALAPPETTLPIPLDETHTEFKTVLAADGKKAAEAFCKECHNDEEMPLSEKHPPKYRCLFCHKFPD